jgi:hypothetical protein
VAYRYAFVGSYMTSGDSQSGMQKDLQLFKLGDATRNVIKLVQMHSRQRLGL